MTLALHRTVSEFRRACDGVRAEGKRVGLVPTMGALHRGHLALVGEAARRGAVAAVTIFVNPTQFGPNEDFTRYPRTLDRDLLLCEQAGVAHVFQPDTAQMYPSGERTRVRVSALVDHLCGPHRPGHFEGVATIVAKLFAVTGPCLAIFGRKDYQQCKVVERMARDLLLPVDIVESPTVRDDDGLALSSRNAYLSADERVRARAIPRGLSRVARAFAGGERRTAALEALLCGELEAGGLTPQYAGLFTPDELQPLGAEVPERALVAVAAYSGATRLIDNLVLGEDPAPIALEAGVGA